MSRAPGLVQGREWERDTRMEGTAAKLPRGTARARVGEGVEIACTRGNGKYSRQAGSFV